MGAFLPDLSCLKIQFFSRNFSYAYLLRVQTRLPEDLIPNCVFLALIPTQSTTGRPRNGLYLNDPSFFNGSLINSSPTVFVELRDSSDQHHRNRYYHEIIATLDTQPPREFVLNDFYEGELMTLPKGS